MSEIFSRGIFLIVSFTYTIFKYPIWVSIFIRGVTNKYPWLHFAFPYPISSKLHSLPFPRISQNTTRLRLMVFWLILGNGNSCNFEQYPTRYVKNSTRLRLVEFLSYLVGYLENTPRTNFKSPKFWRFEIGPRGIFSKFSRSSISPGIFLTQFS